MTSGSDLGLVLVIMLLLAIFVVVSASQFVARSRSRDDGPRLDLVHRYFSGRPEVVLHGHQWSVTAAEIRRLAFERGYVEALQPNPAVLVFHLRPFPYSQPPPVGAPTPQHLRAGAELGARLRSRQTMWMQPGMLGLTPPELMALAGAHGAHVTHAVGPRTNPAMLLSRVPVAHLGETLHDNRRKPLSSSQIEWVSTGAGLASMLAILMLMIVNASATAMPSAALWGLLLLATVGALLALTAPGALARSSLDSRMRRLVHEFAGKPRITLDAELYRLDFSVIADVAAQMGYVYQGAQVGWTSRPRSIRWNQTLISYSRMLHAPDPGDASAPKPHRAGW